MVKVAIKLLNLRGFAKIYVLLWSCQSQDFRNKFPITLVSPIIVQVGIKVQVGKISKIDKKVQDGILPCRLEIWELCYYELWLFIKISKFSKSAGWNKVVQVGKFLKFNKVCCTIIWETKVMFCVCHQTEKM